MKSSVSVFKITQTAVFAAIICLTTAFLFHIPAGAGGYIHLGDAFIYLAACFLPTPHAVAAAAIGSGLADLMSGAPAWIPFTVVIKSLMALAFTCKSEKILNLRNVIGCVAAGVICIGGYYLAEALFFYDNWITPLLSIPTGGLVQSGGAAVIFLVVGAILDAVHIKKHLRRLQ